MNLSLGRKNAGVQKLVWGYFVALRFAMNKQLICRQQMAHNFGWARIILHELRMDIFLFVKLLDTYKYLSSVFIPVFIS